MPAESVLDDRELWEAASRVLDEHGDRVGNFLIDRVNALYAARDTNGVRVWLDIGERIRQLVPPNDETKLN